MSRDSGITADASLKYDAERDCLVLSVSVSNSSSEAKGNIGIAFVPPPGIACERGLEVHGAGARYAAFALSSAIGAGEKIERTFDLAIEEYSEGPLELVHVGLLVHGYTQPLASIKGYLPPDVNLEVKVDASSIVVGSVGIANVSVANVGRTCAWDVSVDLQTDADLVLLDAETRRGKRVPTVLGRIAYGERRQFAVALSAPTVVERMTRNIEAVATAKGHTSTGGTTIQIVAPRLLRIDLLPEAKASWVHGVARPVQIRITNEGTGVAQRIEMLAGTLGDLRIALPDGVGATRTMRARRRVFRWITSELRPGESAEVTAMVTPVAGEDSSRQLLIQARLDESDDDGVHATLDVTPNPGARFGPATGLGNVDEVGFVGDLVRVPLLVENAGTTAMRGVAVALALPNGLTLDGVEHSVAAIDGDATVLFGTIAASSTIQAMLELRVGALPLGEHVFSVGANVTAWNAYGFTLQPSR